MGQEGGVRRDASRAGGCASDGGAVIELSSGIPLGFIQKENQGFL